MTIMFKVTLLPPGGPRGPAGARRAGGESLARGNPKMVREDPCVFGLERGTIEERGTIGQTGTVVKKRG